MMGKSVKFMMFLIFICIFSGCSIKEEPFIIPVNYTGEAVVKVYTQKTENIYDVKITSRDNNFSLNINDGTTTWNIAMDGDTCNLINDKFKDNIVIINNFRLADSLVTDLDLSKFDSYLDPTPNELIYWDGTYKHVLNFSKENLLPENIFIYKNDNLVKAIQYNKLIIE